MEEKETIRLLNDTFPPLIDGVANTVMNYAQNLLDSPYLYHVILYIVAGLLLQALHAILSKAS